LEIQSSQYNGLGGEAVMVARGAREDSHARERESVRKREKKERLWRRGIGFYGFFQSLQQIFFLWAADRLPKRGG